MFSFMLSEETNARLAAEKAEVVRLHGLTDRWLAHALLQLTRKARAERPELRPIDDGYAESLVWRIAPEIARRLGASGLFQQELDSELKSTSLKNLRNRLASTLANTERPAHSRRRELSAWFLVTREPCNGNPLAIAMDRLCPGSLTDRDDRMTRAIAEVARSRGCVYDGVWTPSLMTYHTSGKVLPMI